MMTYKSWFKAASLPLLVLFVALAAMLFNRPAASTAAQETAVPTTPPDAAAGLAIYNERCAVCHGEMGDGQGQQAVQAGLQPPSFAEPTYRLTADPARMFDVISNGNVANGMPPFGVGSSNPLSEADIWNLVALAYSFSTRPDDIAAGEALAAELGAEPDTWPGLDYWFGRSGEAILADLESENVLGIDLAGLSEAEKLSLIDYGRSLHYRYTDPLTAFAPIAQATLSGQVINGTTNDTVTEGEVRLRAFNLQLEVLYSETVPLNEDGTFSFALENVPPDWVFLADVVYGDLSFNSSPAQVSNTQPAAQMPIFVFETTSDPTVVQIDQLRMLLSFTQDQLLVSELYQFSNADAAVFVGEAGSADQGTVEIQLPAGAANVQFQRGFGTTQESFIPADEMIQTETGWADTVPLRPGASSSILLVSYALPYSDGLLLAHPLAYPVGNATTILPQVGVELIGEDWVFQGVQETVSGTFEGYTNSQLGNAAALGFTLDGRPTQIIDSQGNPIAARNQNSELLLGGGGLVLALAVGLFFIQRWRTEQSTMAVAANGRVAQKQDIQALLQVIADLDDAYRAGEIDETAYTQQRQELKEQVAAVWK